MAGLIARARLAGRPSIGVRRADVGWPIVVGTPAAFFLAWLLTVSLQAACAFVLVLLVVGLHQYDRRWGIVAMFALWFLAPGLRRVLGLHTGFVENDPLSLAPFLATASLAALELVQSHVPTQIRRILMLAAAGMALGVPAGLLLGPRAAVYACGAYLGGLSAAVLGFNERGTLLRSSTLRAVLLYGLPAIAGYAILQRILPLPHWDQNWIDSADFNSLGAPNEGGKVRVFATLNSPGALAPLLALSLLCYLTIRPRHPSVALLGAALLVVALQLTFVRGAWIAFMAAAVAHVVASRGGSARLVFGTGALIAALTVALSPVSQTAHDVVDRFSTIGHLSVDQSANDRSATVSQTLPKAIAAPLGHGLGSAGEPSKLTGSNSELRAPDNGYLALIYQVGPIGFVLVMWAVGLMLRAAWIGARDQAPGQELRLLLFALFFFTIVELFAGDEFYGIHAVIFWFIGGQVLGYEFRRRRDRERERRRREIPVVSFG
ncbi:MAG: putative inorganic carbon ((-)) transporter [Thermoleophilaceae bacterium]|nr:putative inorganic carbon ((-)) transporter [Thermoleophilaceae bacterium]